MTLARHHSRERTPADRGLGLGRAQREPIANSVSTYLRLFAEASDLTREAVTARGAEVGERLAALRPDLLEEIAGVAAGAGQPEELLLAVNARTELLAGGTFASAGAECSVAGVRSHGLLAQNWDFHPELAASRLLWVVEPPGERWFATFTEAGIVAKTGLNETGLAVTLNFLASSADGGVDGVPVHVVLRTLLDSCATPADAARLLGDASVTVSACVTVAGPRALASYELSPTGVRVLAPDVDGRLAHTNHFIDAEGVVDLIAAGSGAASSFDRLEHVRSALGRLGDGDPLPAVQAVLSSDPAFQVPDPDEPWPFLTSTLATVAYDVEARRMWIRAEDDPAAPLREVVLPPVAA